jgi:hypothetical protein
MDKDMCTERERSLEEWRPPRATGERSQTDAS